MRVTVNIPDQLELLNEVDTEKKTIKGKGYTLKRKSPKVGRNNLCNCGSGKKYKTCCITK
jgi:uncharacterized protein YecA (UPF0149 family)